MGSVSETVCTTSASGKPSFSIRVAMRVVKVDKMLAFTPLPSPSEKTSVAISGPGEKTTLSPHNSSSFLLICSRAYSKKTFTATAPSERGP